MIVSHDVKRPGSTIPPEVPGIPRAWDREAIGDRRAPDEPVLKGLFTGLQRHSVIPVPFDHLWNFSNDVREVLFAIEDQQRGLSIAPS